MSKAGDIRDIVSVIYPIASFRRSMSYGDVVFLLNPAHSTFTSDEAFTRVRIALIEHLKDRTVIEQGPNHVLWTGDGVKYHFLLSRGCRGTMSVEVRVEAELTKEHLVLMREGPSRNERFSRSAPKKWR